MKVHTPKPRLTLLAAGGTISLTRDPQTGKSILGLSGADLLQRMALAEAFEVRVIDLVGRAKPLRQPEELLDMARRIQQSAEVSDGIVVTHGTDALEEVAYFVDEAVGAPEGWRDGRVPGMYLTGRSGG